MTTSADQALTVLQLTRLLQEMLESALPPLWVRGELSNVVRPQSGHVYFTLKDENSQIRGVIWRNTAQALPFTLKDGMEVCCLGALEIYPPRGVYQLMVREIQPQGMGSLQLALQQRMEKLAAEGLFEAERKRPLPKFPRRIAIVTSPTGAAIRDFLQVLRRRWRGAQVLLIPAKVQGEGSALEIARGVQVANEITPSPDLLVVGRGGGSLEDLWSFNEEIVVRAIAASQIPVISAVGHEIDITLSDLAADVRALTPSEAAERAVPAVEEILRRLRTAGGRLQRAAGQKLERLRARLETIRHSNALRHPRQRWREASRRVDELQTRAELAIRRRLETQRELVETLAGKLESLSPLAVLRRGYSRTEKTENQELLHSAEQLQIGDRITTRLADGEIVSRVETRKTGKESP